LLLTGNVMISPDALTGPGGVVLDNAKHLNVFRQWAAAGTLDGNQLWMQINHPGVRFIKPWESKHYDHRA
jgi:2,4-dienoyl-CoA reductase-like NADH-dependent reductase (Old Yellow Enzyme family)